MQVTHFVLRLTKLPFHLLHLAAIRHWTLRLRLHFYVLSHISLAPLFQLAAALPLLSEIRVLVLNLQSPSPRLPAPVHRIQVVLRHNSARGVRRAARTRRAVGAPRHGGGKGGGEGGEEGGDGRGNREGRERGQQRTRARGPQWGQQRGGGRAGGRGAGGRGAGGRGAGGRGAGGGPCDERGAEGREKRRQRRGKVHRSRKKLRAIPASPDTATVRGIRMALQGSFGEIIGHFVIWQCRNDCLGVHGFIAPRRRSLR